MKIFVAHSSGYDYKNELYFPIRNSESLKIYEIFLPKEKSENEVITRDIIKNSNVVIAEVSYPSTGQGIELGWADIFGVPIVCIYKSDAKISQSLNKLTDKFYTYSNANDMVQKIASAIQTIQV